MSKSLCSIKLHKPLNSPNTFVFASGFRCEPCMPLLFEDMYFTILSTYLVTEPPFVTSVFRLMGLSCVSIIIVIIITIIIIIIKAVQDVYMLYVPK